MHPTDQGQNPDTTETTVSFRQLLGFFAMIIGMFMALLDIQIVASSLLNIQAGLATTYDEISWVQTSYLIAEVISIPLSGMLSRILSTRIVFFISSIGFTFMSIACAFAWNIESMIIFRAGQGLLGGAMIPTVFATSFAIFPKSKQPLVTVIMGLVATMAPTLGPIIGGYINNTYSWHWLFLINIIPGIFVTVVVWFCCNFDKADYTLAKGFDWPGAIYMALFLGSLQYILEEGVRNNWFDSNAICLASVICTLSSTLFFYRVFTYYNPIVDLSAYKHRNFVIGSSFSFILGIGLYGTTFLIPTFLSNVKGYNSLQIGMVMTVTGLSQFFSAPIAGLLSKYCNLKWVLCFGIILFWFALDAATNLTVDSAFNELFLTQVLRGMSLMCCFMPINIITLGDIPLKQLKNASALYNLNRNLGGAIGIAILNNCLNNRTVLHASNLSDSLNTSHSLMGITYNYLFNYFDLLIADAPRAIAKVYANMVSMEALVMAFNDCFLMTSYIFLASLVMLPFIIKIKNTEHVMAE